ncbi:hypothetical protein [Sulfurospirillum cavolei]|uniref:hypothetical protein n=1 Tax=Sulfurospirillum cavolei TaxID=366522 RepID=UPI001E415166|nr:hypothetical protein [Sulfurospirillum cavolei]
MTERKISYCSALLALLLPLKTAVDFDEEGVGAVFSVLCVLEGVTTSEDVILYVELFTEELEVALGLEEES